MQMMQQQKDKIEYQKQKISQQNQDHEFEKKKVSGYDFTGLH